MTAMQGFDTEVYPFAKKANRHLDAASIPEKIVPVSKPQGGFPWPNIQRPVLSFIQTETTCLPGTHEKAPPFERMTALTSDWALGFLPTYHAFKLEVDFGVAFRSVMIG